ncbi:MAG: hypothetical protein ABSF44_08670 [Candidatus Bathyarchaeia archaeon]
MLRKALVSIILAIFLLATITPSLAQNNVDSATIHQKAVQYLVNNYNSKIGLIPETNNSPTYWLVSDNLLAYYALRNDDPTISNEIAATLKNYVNSNNLPHDSNGLPISYKHEALIGDVLPDVFRNSSQSNGSSLINGSNYSIVTEVDNYTQMNDWTSYADLLALRGISLFNQGNISGATDNYNAMIKMWDGNGFADKPFLNPNSQSYHIYQTYKIGLALILSNDLNIVNASVNNRVENIIASLQQSNGGVITGYVLVNGSIVPSVSATANTETTAIIALANVKDNYPFPSGNPTQEVVIVSFTVACISFTIVYLVRKVQIIAKTKTKR